eukprot:UN19231
MQFELSIVLIDLLHPYPLLVVPFLNSPVAFHISASILPPVLSIECCLLPNHDYV